MTDRPLKAELAKKDLHLKHRGMDELTILTNYRVRDLVCSDASDE
jgi:hypothetical protein